MTAKMRRIRPVASLVLVLAVLFAGIGMTPAGSAPAAREAGEPVRPSAGGATLSVEATPAEQAAAAAGWTREARLAARPLSWTAPASLPLDAGEQPGGVPGFSPSGPPAPGSETAARREFAAEYASPADGPVPAAPEGTAGVYDSYVANFYDTHMWLDYPFKAVGKLYLQTWDGVPAYCSASVISPNDIIVTAAHCLYDNVNKKWNGNWVFVPAERNGSAPYGTFPYSAGTVLTAWVNGSGSAAWRYNVGLLRLSHNAAERRVTYYTGWLGRAWNYGATQRLNAFGYPGNLMSGAYSWLCQAESFSAGTDLLGLGCDQLSGSGGGPWLWKYLPYQSSYNFVMATTAGSVADSTYGNTLYGPRFSGNNIVPLCTVMSCNHGSIYLPLIRR